MTCFYCGGLMVWVGPMTALTHTQCQSCGGVNCQVVEPEEETKQIRRWPCGTEQAMPSEPYGWLSDDFEVVTVPLDYEVGE